MVEQLHFLRPEFLWLFLPALLVLWSAWHWLAHESGWQKVIDPRLISHLLDQAPTTSAKWPVYVLAAALALAIVALAGPAWQKLPQPVQQSEDALLIALDLSLSMRAGDIKPTRITRAQHKIKDILQRRNEGLTALIAYAGDAHTVVPFTDDAATIAAMVPALTPEIMPKLGSRPDLAIELARQLLQDAGLQHARLLLVSDGIFKKDIGRISDALGDKLALSILAIGTREGGPIPLPQGGFLQDESNGIVVPQLTVENFQQLSKRNNGRYSELQIGPQDIDQLLATDFERRSATREIDREFDVWRDAGASLVLFLLPIALLAFRRGWLLSLTLLVLVQVPQPSAALEWADLWANKNQRASEALASGNAERAAELFNDPDWKASAKYRAGDFPGAAELFANRNKYNQANALAKTGKLQEAVDLYSQALEQHPDNEDAAFNKKLVEELLKQQQEQEQQQNQDGEENEQQDGGQQEEQQQNQQGQNGQQQDQQISNSEQQNRQDDNEQQSSDQSDGEQQEQQEQQAQSGNDEQQQEQQQTGGDNGGEQKPEETQQAEAQAATEQESESEQQQALQQWLRKVPDDPGGLLRNKFRYQYEQNRQRQEYYDESSQPW
ncbi:MAG: VWA domain-containing protein [Pseudomonadales bacterium]